MICGTYKSLPNSKHVFKTFLYLFNVKQKNKKRFFATIRFTLLCIRKRSNPRVSKYGLYALIKVIVFNWLLKERQEVLPDLGSTEGWEWCGNACGSKHRLIMGNRNNGGVKAVNNNWQSNENSNIGFRVLAVPLGNGFNPTPYHFPNL